MVGGSGGGRGGGGASADLHSAARSGDLAAVQSIISSNPLAVNSRDKHSRTPLHLAAWAGHNEVVSYLCKNKADVGAAAVDDMGAIHFASQKGHLEVVRTLLSVGASVKSITRKGLSPLHYAAQGSHFELVKYLVKKGANVRATTKAGKNPADVAGNAETQNFLEECEEEARKAKANNKKKTEEVKPESCSNEGDTKDLKRKDSEDGNEEGKEEASQVAKKPKVALSHLQETDDTEVDQEEEDTEEPNNLTCSNPSEVST
ncbi:PREDICTED: 26S proteasome non-ATPase regulatory subunit 10-like isoform X3 [Camelina sativa]|uniref:26S proteasome non-ATPase regulatory subunit 10-like isoform X1 n=1 Tax=Camelina sativa TaxID=90675 RepID=A0ABM0V1F6_CAMSA|nr:PREDICTED: 26S proteasome non-ATPase regulatory subunit 10-like isoform X1 [Camelina sativa]XP_010449390.1 PREDICTED: 26S proteasome non-ATPase regulatory subunit 10-like isoform X2 [Camelina sativa]XP_010449391.1 PREDICTED: 26S proteasome non-ATPase regulatory subunit 10-like isoform X3 [Camelina sativa]